MTGITAELDSPNLPEGWVWADRIALRDTYALPSAFRGFSQQVVRRLGHF